MTFPALEGLGLSWLRHGFVLRQPGIEVAAARQEMLERLRPAHRLAHEALGFAPEALALAEQVHGAGVAVVEGAEPANGPWPGVDGLATSRPGRVLGIHVADCAAVYVADPTRRAVALLHSGRKGSEQGIIKAAIAEMERSYGSRAADLVVQVSPCIRPPLYEIDFAALIRRDARAMGVPASHIHDEKICTGSDLERFYSYRMEKGCTGRMFALLGIAADSVEESAGK